MDELPDHQAAAKQQNFDYGLISANNPLREIPDEQLRGVQVASNTVYAYTSPLMSRRSFAPNAEYSQNVQSAQFPSQFAPIATVGFTGSASNVSRPVVVSNSQCQTSSSQSRNSCENIHPPMDPDPGGVASSVGGGIANFSYGVPFSHAGTNQPNHVLGGGSNMHPTPILCVPVGANSQAFQSHGHAPTAVFYQPVQIASGTAPMLIHATAGNNMIGPQGHPANQPEYFYAVPFPSAQFVAAPHHQIAPHPQLASRASHSTTSSREGSVSPFINQSFPEYPHVSTLVNNPTPISISMSLAEQAIRRSASISSGDGGGLNSVQLCAASVSPVTSILPLETRTNMSSPSAAVVAPTHTRLSSEMNEYRPLATMTSSSIASPMPNTNYPVMANQQVVWRDHSLDNLPSVGPSEASPYSHQSPPPAVASDNLAAMYSVDDSVLPRYHMGAKVEKEHGRTPLFGQQPSWWGEGEGDYPSDSCPTQPPKIYPASSMPATTIDYSREHQSQKTSPKPSRRSGPARLDTSTTGHTSDRDSSSNSKMRGESMAFTIEFESDKSGPKITGMKSASEAVESAEKLQRDKGVAAAARLAEKRNRSMFRRSLQPQSMESNKHSSMHQLMEEENETGNDSSTETPSGKQYLLNKMLGDNNMYADNTVSAFLRVKPDRETLSDAGTYVVDRIDSDALISEDEKEPPRSFVERLPVIEQEDEKTTNSSCASKSPLEETVDFVNDEADSVCNSEPASRTRRPRTKTFETDGDLFSARSEPIPDMVDDIRQKRGLLKQLLKINQDKEEQQPCVKPAPPTSVASKSARPATTAANHAGPPANRKSVLSSTPTPPAYLGRKAHSFVRSTSVTPGTASNNRTSNAPTPANHRRSIAGGAQKATAASKANAANNSSAANFGRTDGGRFSMRATSPAVTQRFTKNPASSSGGQVIRNKAVEKKQEADKQAWLRRKQYDPRKAVEKSKAGPGAPGYLSSRSQSFHAGAIAAANNMSVSCTSAIITEPMGQGDTALAAFSKNMADNLNKMSCDMASDFDPTKVTIPLRDWNALQTAVNDLKDSCIASLDHLKEVPEYGNQCDVLVYALQNSARRPAANNSKPQSELQLKEIHEKIQHLSTAFEVLDNFVLNSAPRDEAPQRNQPTNGGRTQDQPRSGRRLNKSEAFVVPM